MSGVPRAKNCGQAEKSPLALPVRATEGADGLGAPAGTSVNCPAALPRSWPVFPGRCLQPEWAWPECRRRNEGTGPAPPPGRQGPGAVCCGNLQPFFVLSSRGGREKVEAGQKPWSVQMVNWGKARAGPGLCRTKGMKNPGGRVSAASEVGGVASRHPSLQVLVRPAPSEYPPRALCRWAFSTCGTWTRRAKPGIHPSNRVMTAVGPKAIAGVRPQYLLPVTFVDDQTTAHAPGLNRRKTHPGSSSGLGGGLAFALAAAMTGAARLRSQASE